MDLDRNIGRVSEKDVTGILSEEHSLFGGNGQGYTIYGTGEPITVSSARDLVENEVGEDLRTVQHYFGIFGLVEYVEGMTSRGLRGIVDIANFPAPRSYTLQEGIEQIPGQA